MRQTHISTNKPNTIVRESEADSARKVGSILDAFSAEFDGHMDRLLVADDVPESLIEAMRYTALAPGKRVRPFLVVRCCELAGGQRADAWLAAGAVECVHAFSLIHDDLPAMDDDDIRRGQPSNHKKFGEAMAVLAGDALVVRAFELLASAESKVERVAALVRELATGAGWVGMIGGQAADILSAHKPLELSQTQFIHTRKTAALFRAACRLGAITGGGAKEAVDDLGHFGEKVGQAFQIADDLLDLTSTDGAMGKGVAKDARSGKQTVPACVGMERSRELGQASVDAAIDALARFGPDADDLRDLANFVLARHY